jgi:putative ABC transport system permease protein
VFAEAAVVAALAGLVGLLGGLGLAKGMLMNSLSSLGVTDSVRAHFEVPWGDVLVLTAIGVVIALLGSVSPLLRARRADVVQALRGEAGGAPTVAPRAFRLAVFLLVIAALPAVYFLSVPLVGEAEREFVGLVLLGLGVLALLVGTPLLVPGPVGLAARRLAAPLARISPFSGLLAARSISLSPTRVAACVASIALVTAAFVGLRGITSSLALEVETWCEEGVEGKLWATELPEVPVAQLADGLRERGLIAALEPLDTRLTAPFRIVGLPAEELLRFGPLRDDPELLRTMRTRPAMLITGRLATQRGLEVGQSVPVATPSSGVVPFEVVGISDAYGYSFQPHERAYAVVADTHLERLFCLDVAHTRAVAMVLAPGVDAGRLREGLVAELKALGAPNPEAFNLRGDWEIREYELFDIKRDFVLFDVILVLTLLLAGTGVLNGLLLSAMERVKELGVLRAMGADFR